MPHRQIAKAYFMDLCVLAVANLSVLLTWIFDILPLIEKGLNILILSITAVTAVFRFVKLLSTKKVKDESETVL